MKEARKKTCTQSKKHSQLQQERSIKLYSNFKIDFTSFKCRADLSAGKDLRLPRDELGGENKSE